jgi:hypothetical protein
MCLVKWDCLSFWQISSPSIPERNTSNKISWGSENFKALLARFQSKKLTHQNPSLVIKILRPLKGLYHHLLQIFVA